MCPAVACCCCALGCGVCPAAAACCCCCFGSALEGGVCPAANCTAFWFVVAAPGLGVVLFVATALPGKGVCPACLVAAPLLAAAGRGVCGGGDVMGSGDEMLAGVFREAAKLTLGAAGVVGCCSGTKGGTAAGGDGS